MKQNMRDYIPPVIPSEWSGSRRRYALMVKDILDELHQPIREEWLNGVLQDKINYGGAESVRDYSTSPHATGAKWIDGRAIFKVTLAVGVTANTPYTIDIRNIDMVIDQEGCIVPSNGKCFGIGEHVYVSRASANARFKINSDVSGMAYITIYYVLSE